MVLLLALCLTILAIYLIKTSKNLHERFIELGDMSGMTLSEISSKIGKPTSIFQYEHCILAVWQEGGLFETNRSIDLIFDIEKKLVKIRSQATY